MNWLLLGVLLIILIFVIRGFRRGFLRVLYSLVAVLLLIGLVGYATPHVSGYLKEHTTIYANISQRWEEKIQNSAEGVIDSTVQGQQEALEAAGIQLPDVLEERIFGTGLDKIGESVENTGVYQQAGERMASVIVAVLAFLAALILAILIVWLIGKITDVVNKIPVIKGINRFFGLFAGAFQGIIVIWLLFLLLSIFSATAFGSVLISYIEESPFLNILYNHNVVLEILMHLF